MNKFPTIDGNLWRKSLTRARKRRTLREIEIKEFIQKEKTRLKITK